MTKISPENFYHIYLKDRCVYNNLTKKDFEERYLEMKAMVGLMKTDYEEDDLSYEVVETLVSAEESSY
jgi:hypothetical protein|tara:strand:- start:6984 stop:7187 length:204 start_codon:yes stop_codon:yes gene_type:complete